MKKRTIKRHLTVIAFAAIVFSFLGAGEARCQNAKSADPTLAAVIDGKTISQAELESLVHNRMLSIETSAYNLKQQALNEAIDRILLEQEADRRNTSVNQLSRDEIDAKVRPPSQEEIKAVYESGKDRFVDKSEADALKQIEADLHQSRVVMRRSQFLSQLRSKAKIVVNLEPPRIQVTADDVRVRGPKTAPVTIVEFTDFQCPYCGRVAGMMKQIEEEFGDKIRFVFRDFPLPMHKDAPKAAEAASCADEQGKFWEMHDKLFENQSSLRVADLKRYAADLGLRADQFNQCLDSQKYAKRWRDDRDEGAGYGITGTPTFFINGRILVGAVPIESFTQIVREELRRTAALRPAPSASQRPPTGHSR